jgi:hypothetical protein
MSQDIECVSDHSERDDVEYVRDNMHAALHKAVTSFPDSGVCLFVFFNGNDGMRIAHMSNMENPQIVEVMKSWMEHQEKPDERDRQH